MGEPSRQGNLIVANEQAAPSLPWSIHLGAGMANYAFICAITTDNVDYIDVEMIQPGDLC